MRDDKNETAPAELADAIDLLRATPTVRPEWRAELLDRTASQARPGRRVSLSVPWALAAGLVCALMGAGSVMVLRDLSKPAAVVAKRPPVSDAVMLPVRFSLSAPNAARVTIVGDFNNWNPTILPMRRSADGRIWEVEVRLPLGRYNYAFMVDGQLARDPRAPSTADDDFGTPNSVLMVHGT